MGNKVLQELEAKSPWTMSDKVLQELEAKSPQKMGKAIQALEGNKTLENW